MTLPYLTTLGHLREKEVETVAEAKGDSGLSDAESVVEADEESRLSDAETVVELEADEDYELSDAKTVVEAVEDWELSDSETVIEADEDWGLSYAETVVESDEDYELSDTETSHGSTSNSSSDVELCNKMNKSDQGGTTDLNHPFSSEVHMVAFVLTNLNAYVFASVKDFMQDIMTSKDLREISDIVKRLFDLPLEFNEETISIAKGYMFNIMSNSLNNSGRFALAEFWKAIYGLQNHRVAKELQIEFLKHLEHILLKRTAPGYAERNNKKRLELLQINKMSNLVEIQMLQECISTLQTRNYESAMQTTELLIMIYSFGCLKFRIIVQILINLLNSSDSISLHWLVHFMDKSGDQMDKDLASAEMDKSLNHEMLLIYSKLEDWSNKDVIIPGVSADLSRKARQIVLRKNATIFNLEWTKTDNQQNEMHSGSDWDTPFVQEDQQKNMQRRRRRRKKKDDAIPKDQIIVQKNSMDDLTQQFLEENPTVASTSM